MSRFFHGKNWEKGINPFCQYESYFSIIKASLNYSLCYIKYFGFRKERLMNIFIICSVINTIILCIHFFPWHFSFQFDTYLYQKVNKS